MTCLEKKEERGRMERVHIRFLHSLLLRLSESLGHFFGSLWFTLVHFGSFCLLHFQSNPLALWLDMSRQSDLQPKYDVRGQGLIRS